MSHLEVIACNTADEYLNKLSLCNSSWWENDAKCDWIFRGQNSNGPLIPSLYRKDMPPNHPQLLYQNIFDKIHNELITTVPNMSATINNMVNDTRYKLGDGQKKNLAELIKAAFIEIALTENFLLACNKVRLHTPTLQLFKDQYSGSSSVEYFYNRLMNDILAEFTHALKNFKIQLRVGFTRLLNFHYPEAMALARHHGVPSRLLDWSSDPLIAAFFSACKLYDDNDICVWALNKKYLGPYIGSGQITFHEKLSKTGLEFLHIQKGLFTDMTGIEAYYCNYGEWPTLDQYLLTTYTDHHNQPTPQETYLKKIELKAAEKGALLIRLNRMGINKYGLMPTYDNVAQSVLPLT